MKYLHALLLALTCYFIPPNKAQAQTPTEFTKGFVLHAKLHNGAITNFNNGADLYTGGIQFIPQFTVKEGLLRAGAVAGFFYSGKNWEAQFGPTASIKIKTINAGVFGSAANIHATVDHIWGTGKQKLIGGGLHVDLLNKLILGITAHRDYAFNTWWLQTAIGFKLSKTKKVKEPFNE